MGKVHAELILLNTYLKTFLSFPHRKILTALGVPELQSQGKL